MMWKNSVNKKEMIVKMREKINIVTFFILPVALLLSMWILLFLKVMIFGH